MPNDAGHWLRLCGRRPLKSVLGFLAIALVIGNTDHIPNICVFAQAGCAPEIETPGNTLLDDPKLLVGSCHVQPESYVARYSNVIIHGRAEGSGHCTTQIWSGFPASCNVTWDGDRGVSQIAVKYDRPQWPSELSATPIRARQPLTGGAWHWPILDSEDPIFSFGPSQIGTAYFGTYQVRQQGVIFTTPCIMLPATTELKSITFYSVDCVPTWFVTPEGDLQRLPPGQTVTINAPASIRDDVMAAAQAWQTALANYGIVVEFVPGVCGPQQGATCVIVDEATVPGNPIACGGIQANHDASTGFINSNTHIYIPDWYDDYPGRRQGVAAHELGHALGLENSACAPQHSVMWTPAQQGSVNCRLSPTGAANLPTPSDGMAAARTAYGTASRAVCPVQ